MTIAKKEKSGNKKKKEKRKRKRKRKKKKKTKERGAGVRVSDRSGSVSQKVMLGIRVTHQTGTYPEAM